MRVIGTLIPALLLLACTSSSQVSTGPVDRCESTECFNQLQVRNYEVVDNTTLIVYVGGQNCPFKVEFAGTFCDLTFMPGGQLVFRADTMRSLRESDALLTRVCSRDSNIGIDEGPFSTAPGGDAFPDQRLPCRIQAIASLTDDELLELYVDKQITPPPPPFGTGQIEVPEQAEPAGQEEEGAAGTVAAPAESSLSPTAANAPGN